VRGGARPRLVVPALLAGRHHLESIFGRQLAPLAEEGMLGVGEVAKPTFASSVVPTCGKRSQRGNKGVG
jgi:hypothetical protein